MNSNQRWMNIFKNKPIDRPAFKLWACSIGQDIKHPAYQKVYDLAVKTTDIMEGSGSMFDIYWGSDSGVKITHKDVPRPDGYGEWVDKITTVDINGHKLQSTHRYSLLGNPGYDTEHLVKNVDDLKAIMSIDYKPFDMDVSNYKALVEKVGDRGVATFGLDHAAYSAQRLMGSELFAYMCIDNRDILKESITIFGDRINNHVKATFETGIKPVFAWVGPELCTPPLVRMDEFEEFVFDIDTPICSTIHNGGGFTWMHCHGRVGKLLTRYQEMGIDVLNPLEPPPQGDVTLKEAVDIVGNKLGLEGNIENGSLVLEDEETIREMVYTAVKEGSQGGRFILCPSSGYMEYINPTEQYINNLMVYLEYGLECVEKAGKGTL